jgi:nitrogen PTS system EIIA component
MFRPDFITEQRVRCALDIASKKRLLEGLAGLLATGNPRLDPDLVFERLLDRERLGSTGLGHGIALPHARVKEVGEPMGAFIATAQGLDYDAVDGEPVDLAFALLVPETATEEHLQLLALLAGLFSDPQIRSRLRAATTPADLLRIFDSVPPLV